MIDFNFGSKYRQLNFIKNTYFRKNEVRQQLKLRLKPIYKFFLIKTLINTFSRRNNS